MKFTDEQIRSFQACSSADELQKKALEFGIELSSEKAASILEVNDFEELDTESLDAVSGGCYTTEDQTCHNCKVRFNYDLPVYEYGPKYCDGNHYPFCDACATQLGLK